jgi:polyphenol oxidase
MDPIETTVRDEAPETQTASGPGEARPSRRQFVGGSVLLTGGLVASTLVAPAAQALAAQPDEAHRQRRGAQRGVAVPCPTVRPTTVVRKNITEMSDAEYKALQDAVRIIRARGPLDFTSQQYQARIHDLFCNTSDANKQVHFSWKFLPWHRGYLYYYESILQAAIGDSRLALPYWDWSKDFSIPARYWGAGNPLYDTNRVATPSSQVTPSRTAIQGLLALPLFSSFGGTSAASGQVETGPHNYIHNFIGGDMGDFATAGLDPIFFSGHHSMIDHLWWMWNQDPAHQNPSDPSWLNLRFSYYTPTGQPCEITVREILTLPVTYATSGKEVRAASALGEVTVKRAPVTVELGDITSDSVRSLREPVQRAVQLLIEGVVVPSDQGADVEIYFNEPDAKGESDSPNYAGYFSLVPLGHHGEHTKFNILVDVTQKAEKLASSRGASSVTLVPVPVEKSRFLEGTVRFDRISLVSL